MSTSSYISQKRVWNGPTRGDCIAENAMISSKHPLIGKTGVDILRKGGNAVDAAVAAAFMDCVVEPASNGIGGEGVMTIHLETGENVVIDYVGRPPQSSTSDMYKLTNDTEPGWMMWRKVVGDANVVGHQACTTPGTVAGLAAALEQYGTMSLSDVISPAAKVAKEGFVVGWGTASSIFIGMKLFSQFKEWRKTYLQKGKFPYRPHLITVKNPTKLINKNLAKSLKSIAEHGTDEFYKGWIAEAIVDEMEREGGYITLEDLAMYEPIIHEPDPGSYRGYEVVYDPTHSGTTMLQILKILEGYNLPEYGFGSPESVHLMAEALGLSFADRFKYMGDPGYVKVPLKAMVSNGYAEELRRLISLDKVCELAYGEPWPYEPECTTALAVGDKAGNMVVINQTLVDGFGCGVVVPGTGICLNNAMYGLNPEPGHANSIDGRKRRIQNVCPTLLLKDGNPYLALGAPGGRKIQVSVAHVIVNMIEYGMGIQEAMEAPRIHRETSQVFVESRYPIKVRNGLIELGHDVVWVDQEQYGWGRPVGVHWNPETGMLHGGVHCHMTATESIAIGY